MRHDGRGVTLFCGRMAVAAAMWLSVGVMIHAAPHGPQPGDVYIEFAIHQGGDDWRVTNPNVKDKRAHEYLPNAKLRLPIGSLDGALRAEAVLDRWSGHTGTMQPQIRFNGNTWLDVPPPLNPPGNGDHQRYYFQDNPLIEVPLEHLKSNDVSIVEGTCSHESPQGWGQWGVYSIILRVYYDPAKMRHAAGRIVSPENGATIGEDPTIEIEATSPDGVSRIDVLAWYEGYDENGDGVWLDWHGGWFQPIRGAAAELREHVGTLWRAPYDLVWDTRWVPDQQPRAVKLVARIQSSRGAWTVTQPVTDLTLQRHGQSVRLFRATEIPARFGVRNHSEKSCQISIAPDADLSRAVEAGFHYRTWHGWDGHHEPFQMNGFVYQNGGKNHHYDYDIHRIPAETLRNGDNVFSMSSETEHHMLEVHWPGPALTVRFNTDERP